MKEQSERLECFQEKWPPVFRPETRQNNNLGSGFDSIKTGRTLVNLRRAVIARVLRKSWVARSLGRGYRDASGVRWV